MRSLMIVLLLSAAFAAEAQSQARPLPPGSRPLEEPPPLPLVEQDPALQPQVTTRREDDKEIAEYRMNGKLYMVRVTPKNGKPYTLTDPKGDGTFIRHDNTLAPNLVVPQWVLLEF
jgi:Protein of unknown function (DUF2782)